MNVNIDNKFNDDLLKLVDAKLDDIVDFIFSRSQENITKNGTIDEGTLLRSGNVQREFLEKTITYSVPYAAAIEFGSLPHKIYSVWLEGWVKRKLGVSDKETHRVAFAVAKKIELEGTEAKPFLRPALDELLFGGVKI